jgi:hypothetical protein
MWNTDQAGTSENNVTRYPFFRIFQEGLRSRKVNRSDNLKGNMDGLQPFLYKKTARNKLTGSPGPDSTDRSIMVSRYLLNDCAFLKLWIFLQALSYLAYRRKGTMSVLSGKKKILMQKFSFCKGIKKQVYDLLYIFFRLLI